MFILSLNVLFHYRLTISKPLSQRETVPRTYCFCMIHFQVPGQEYRWVEGPRGGGGGGILPKS